jgi:diaminopimelate decarboxylase
MQDAYEPPMISNELGRTAPLAADDRNFFARGTHVPVLCEIDGVPIAELVRQFGSPLFVFSEHDLREKARRARESFKSCYPATSFGWSFKTNYLNAICQIFREEGWMAEVVSDFEYHKARKLGYKGSEIIFNGPHKTRDVLERAIGEGALIQIDHWDELNIVEEIAKQAREPVAVGIRVWLDAGIKPVWSKFGFALANGEALRAASRVVNHPKLKLHTLHTHIGTYILEPGAYRVATQKLVALREQIHAKERHLVECLNLGGGFPSGSLLYGMVGVAVPPMEAYAEAITDVLNKLPEGKRPQLRLELGRCLVDDAGYLLTSIVAVKRMTRPSPARNDLSAREIKELLILGDNVKVAYVLDAGVNLLYTGAWYQFQVSLARLVKGPLVASRLYGPLCMAIDVVRELVDLPMLEAGDILTVHPVGAYNLTQWMQFIEYRPAVVLIDEHGKPEIIRVRETLDDIDRVERLPPHLSHQP